MDHSAELNTQLIVDLRGNITLTTASGLTTATVTSYNEYGNTQTEATTRPANAWHGQQQRTTNTTTSLIQMGVRLYNSVTGLFLQQDPVHGGNPNTYTHPVDPINGMDLSGKFWEELINCLNVAAELASFVPGPVGVVGSLVGASIAIGRGDWRAAAICGLGLVTGGAIGHLLTKSGHLAKFGERMASSKVFGVNSHLFGRGDTYRLGWLNQKRIRVGWSPLAKTHTSFGWRIGGDKRVRASGNHLGNQLIAAWPERI